MRTIIKLSLAIFCLLPLLSTAQQHPQYSLFMFNKQTINPAYVGSRGTFSINSDYRTQWVKVDGNPETFNIGIHTPLGKGATIPRIAAGLLFTQEEIGVQTRQGYAAQLAYRIPISKATVLSFGLEGSVFAVNFDNSNLRAEEDNDAVVDRLGEGRTSKPNFSAGTYLYNPKYFLGFSSMLLIDRDRDADDVSDVEFKRHFFAMGGYLFRLSESLKLRASLMGKYVGLQDVGDSPFSGDANLSFILNDRFLLGASYRSDNSLIATAQIQLNSFLNVAYGFDFKTSDYAQAAGVSHEIFLGIDIAGKSGPLTSPRFVSYF